MTNKCEEKGTKEYCSTIDSSTPPHENSVQIYNGPAKHFSISRKYLKYWYSCNVDSEIIKTEFNLPEIPSLAEPEVVRHFSNLADKNHHVDKDFYPLGSCTMKYNPKINDKIASFPSFLNVR